MTSGGVVGGQAYGQEFASALVALRSSSGLSRRQLAQATSIDRSVLSRLERGSYPHQITQTLVRKLAEALGGGTTLYRAGGLPIPEATELIAAPDYSDAFLDMHAARRALRQLHLENLAGPIADKSLTSNGLKVDAEKLWRVVDGSSRPPTRGVDADSLPAATRRFNVAHAAAHIVLSSQCALPMMSPPELDANDLAGALLAPRALMIQGLKAAFTSPVDPWSPDAGNLVVLVADYFIIPGWVAVRRIGTTEELNYYLDLHEEN